jgi:hypothetical protein
MTDLRKARVDQLLPQLLIGAGVFEDLRLPTVPVLASFVSEVV